MIDLKTETVISLSQAAKILPPGRNGRPVHISTLIRGITRGANGHRLDALRQGSRWLTSIEAVQRWCERQAAAANPGNSPTIRTSTATRRASERAERELIAQGM